MKHARGHLVLKRPSETFCAHWPVGDSRAMPRGAWRCERCTRYWGRCHKVCPLCKLRLDERIILRRKIQEAGVEKRILDFVGSYSQVHPLGNRRMLCDVGTFRNCRCKRCRLPKELVSPYDRLLDHLARKNGRGRAQAARWVHLLSSMVALHRYHGILHGMLLAADCGRGPHVSFLRSRVPELLCNDIRPWVWRWLTALFLQYVEDRCDLRGLLGTASSVLLNISIA